MLALVAVVVAGSGGAGCAGGEGVGTTEQATTIAPQAPTLKYVNPSNQNNETSAAWSPGNPFTGAPGALVVGYNDNHGGPTNVMGWAYSTDGTSWTRCDPTVPSCGSTPMVAGQVQWRGDPIIAADGKGNVAYVSMADTSSQIGGLIVAALSSDGGRTFPTTVLVNDNLPPYPPYPCGPAAEDQPSADFDITTDIGRARKLSVVWRHNGGGTFGACIRRGTFCGVGETDPACNGVARPNIVWDTGSGNGISNLDRQDKLYGQSGLIVQAGDGAVTVVAANCDGSMVNCPNTSPQNCAWERVISYDGGITWSGNVHVDDTTSLQTCVVNGGSPPTGGRVQARHRGTFGFARDRRNGDYYVATMHGKSDLRVFRSQNQGSSWALVRQLSSPVGVPTIAMPTLATDSAGRLALMYIQSDPTDTLVQPVFASVATLTTPQNPDPPPDPNNWAFSAMTGFYNPFRTTNRDLGDYMGIAAWDPLLQSDCIGTSRFYPFWTDMLTASPPGPSFLVRTQRMEVGL